MKIYSVREILQKTENMALLENQKDYREKLAAFIRMHTLRVSAINDGAHPKALPNISMLVIADTGCGKTYVASRIAQASNVNFVSIDCSSLSRVGWKGVNLPSLLLKAREKCRDREKFATSIIHFDEFDKLRYHYNSTSGSVEANPQVNLLTLFDGMIQLDGENNGESIDTSRMSFVFSGAFAENDLKGIVKRRISPAKTIGFADAVESVDETNILDNATMDDICTYGIMRELCGRINYLCYIPPLTKDDYRTLIKGSSGSVVQKYRNLFRSIGVAVDITDKACDIIAESASTDTLGARSLDPRVYQFFQECLQEIEDNKTINKVTLDVNEDGQVVITYGYGDRVSVRFVNKLMKLKNDDFAVPDVDFFYHIKNESDVYKLRGFAIKLYKLTKEKNIRLISAFLDYSFYYLWKYCTERDCTLESVEKLAKQTKHCADGFSCNFDALHGMAVNNRCNCEEDRKVLSRLYIKFLDNVNGDPHKILVTAVRVIRKNWYEYLGRTMG